MTVPFSLRLADRLHVKLFCVQSRYTDKAFERTYPWQRQEMFLDGPILEVKGVVFDTMSVRS